ncbi:MAG: DUF1906 domain-containing protein [Bacillota bacterium]
MALGLDTATPCSQSTIDAVVRAGYKFIVRYYCTGGLWKRLSSEEALRLSDPGLWVVSAFQNYNNSIGRFSRSPGRANGRAAYEYARDVIGQPDDTPIYFAVDFDATDAEAKGAIRDYFVAVNDVFVELGGQYDVGVYGSGAICQYMKHDVKLAQYSWLSMSTGWRGYRRYVSQNQWNLKQIKPISIAGVEFDTDESSSLGGGGWRIRPGTTGYREPAGQ